MSVISEQVKELRELADCYYGEVHSYASTISRAADTIETLSNKLSAKNIEKKAVLDCGICETILQEIREKTFSVDVADFYTESAVLFDDVEEIIRSHMKGGNNG